MAFPHDKKSRTTFESCGEHAAEAAEAFARSLAAKGFDAELGDDGAVEHDCDDPAIFAPLCAKAEAPFLKKAAAAKEKEGEKGQGAGSGAGAGGGNR